MLTEGFIKRAARFAEPFCITDGGGFRLKDIDPADTPPGDTRDFLPPRPAARNHDDFVGAILQDRVKCGARGAASAGDKHAGSSNISE